ncbi:MAG TPA: MFS transporter [Actinopolymorphaceae bacterium]|nr:MFS transporter [Actinopolymorphaceae bacterium]
MGTPGSGPAAVSPHRQDPPALGHHPASDEPLPRRGLVFAIVSIALFMGSIDQTSVATALTALQHDMHTRINWSGWTITIYSLGQIVVLPLAGRISDQYGRKRVFLGAIVLFVSASLCCGLAHNIYLLVAFRALQAIGGGAFMPSATGIVADHFGSGRDRALGMFTSIFPIGGIVGPIIGSLFVTYWSWRGIFLINVPLGVILFVLAATLIPESVRKATSRPDVRGVVLFAVTILAAMYGVTSLGNATAGFLHPPFVVAETVALVTGALFVRHTRREAAPFIPLRLLRGKGFGIMNLINLLFGTAALGFGALLPLYAEQRFGFRGLEGGSLLTARAVGMICIAGMAVFALRRTGYRLPIFVGFMIVATGLVGLSLAPVGSMSFGWLAVAAGATGIGMGLAVPASNNASLRLARDQIAAVAGLRGMFRQSGSIVAVSVSTAVLARSGDPGATQSHIFLVFAVLLVCVAPLVRLVPDHRGRW